MSEIVWSDANIGNFVPKIFAEDLHGHTHGVHELCLLLVAHGHDGEHEVDEVEGAEEDDDREEDHVDRTTRCHHLGNSVDYANLIPAWRSSMRVDALFCFLANPPICEELL